MNQLLPTPAPATPEAQTSTVVPVTEAQRYWWLAHYREPEARSSNAHKAVCMIRLEGELEPLLLKQALKQLIHEQPLWRTQLVVKRGVPYQTIKPQIFWQMQSPSPSQCHRDPESLYQWCEQFIRTPFDLLRGPLFSVALIPHSDTEHTFVICSHRILCNQQGLEQFILQLQQRYQALLGEPQTPLNQAIWPSENTRVSGNIPTERQAQPYPRVALDTDHPKGNHTNQAAEYYLELEPETLKALEAAAQRHHVAIKTLLSSAFAILLHRHSGQQQFSFCFDDQSLSGQDAPITGQPLSHPKRINLHLTPNLTLNQSLDRCQNAFRHPVAQECSADEEDTASHCLWQIADHVLPNTFFFSYALTAHLIPTETSQSEYDLAFQVRLGDQALSMSVQFNQDLIRQQRVEQWCQHYRRILQFFIDNQGTTLSGLSLESNSIWYAWRIQLGSVAPFHLPLKSPQEWRHETSVFSEAESKMLDGWLEKHSTAQDHLLLVLTARYFHRLSIKKRPLLVNFVTLEDHLLFQPLIFPPDFEAGCAIENLHRCTGILARTPKLQEWKWRAYKPAMGVDILVGEKISRFEDYLKAKGHSILVELNRYQGRYELKCQYYQPHFRWNCASELHREAQSFM